jgi:hypothetical protein
LSAAVAGLAANQSAAPPKGVAAMPPAAQKIAPAPKAADLKLEAHDYFETKVRPVLAESCYSCHGPERQMAGVRLDSRAAMLKGGNSGPVLAPGDAEKSALIRAIRYTGKVKMPPQGKLPDATIQALTEWVKIGAPWPDTPVSSTAASPTNTFTITPQQQRHWAFQPVRKPALPKVNNAAWCTSPIDFFVLSRLEKRGLKPNPKASKLTLIRRATFDLTGLPPTPGEIDAFLVDREPDAFARVVDRLLASPRYGERWGRHWLDVARYADTKGYSFTEDSRYPNAFTYRDYVIRAFNQDLPYNQFLIEQLAADRVIASLQASGAGTREAGRVPAQRVDEASEKAPDSTTPDSAGVKLTPDTSRLTPLKPKLAAMGFLTVGRRFLNSQPDIIDDRIDVVMRGTMGMTVACARCHNHKFDPIPTKDYYSLYGVFASSTEPAPVVITPASRNEPYFAHEKKLKAAEGEADTLAGSQVERLQGQFRAGAADYMLAARELERTPEAKSCEALAAVRGLNPVVLKRWQKFLNETPKRYETIFQPWKQFQVGKRLTPGDSKTASATASSAAHPLIARALAAGQPPTLAELARQYGAVFAEVEKHWQERLQLHRTAAALAKEAGQKEPDAPKALPDAAEETVRQVLYGRESPPSVKPEELEPFFEAAARDSLRALREKVAKLRETMPPAPEYAMVLEDGKEPRNAKVFIRGNPRNPGEEAPRQFLQIIAGEKRQPFKDGSGRLELARAITDPKNPLTSRLLVNRVWLHHFGEGLVRTPGDFGMRSDPPTHPELLDYLATRFVEQGWSIKKLHRLIMLSSTYQMTSDLSPRSEKIDPENRLLWRMNRQRLELEELRDSLLAVSGRLDLKMGGPAVEITTAPFPPRRTVYGFIDRQNLQGLFRTFDFASPDTTNSQRYRTTIPQQALFMLNSPFVVEQVRALAARPDLLAYKEPERRINYLYRLLFGRLPTTDERALGLRFVDAADKAPSSEVTQASLPAGAAPASVKPAADKKPAVELKPLSPWEQYVQVLLMTNEFTFVD